MIKSLFFLIAVSSASFSIAQDDINRIDYRTTDTILPNRSFADYKAFTKLVAEVEGHRSQRLISVSQFKEMRLDSNTIILDTRSKEMYDAKHIKGALHLNFADFTQSSLWNLLGDTTTRILIYCNNNFINDQFYFPTKMSMPIDEIEMIEINPLKPLGITMALNIPTYINLYGYGYKNVYELADLISIYSLEIEYEGTAVN